MIFFLYRHHATYGAIALLLVGKYTAILVKQWVVVWVAYTECPGWEFRPWSSMLEWMIVLSCAYLKHLKIFLIILLVSKCVDKEFP